VIDVVQRVRERVPAPAAGGVLGCRSARSGACYRDRVHHRSALLLLTALAACAPPPAPAAAGAPTVPARCAVRGEASPRPRDRIFLGPAPGASVFAAFTGGSLDVALFALDPAPEGRLRATVRSSGFELSGWVARETFTLRAARDLPIVAGLAAIRRGARLDVAGGPRPLARTSDTDFDDLAAPVDCAALTFARVPDSPAPSAPVRHVHLRGARATLRAAPAGEPALALTARRPGPTFRVLEAQGGHSLVVYEHGTLLTGWIADADLEPGEGPDCDHCYGEGFVPDVDDRCPNVPEAGSGREAGGCPDADPPPVRLHPTADLALRLFPSRDAPQIGWALRGADLYLVAREGNFARARPAAYVVTPEPGADFWVDLGEAAPGR